VITDSLRAQENEAAAECWQRLMELGRRAAPYGRYGAFVNAATLYRAGNCAEARRSFEALGEQYSPRAGEWCFLAMTHHRLGNDREARHCLAEAVRWIDEADRHDLDDLTGTAPAWGEWAERAEFPLLLGEARSLIESPASSRHEAAAPR
jgi:hypothetical protein